MPCIAQEIEDFARDMLFTVVDTSCDAQGLDVEASMSGGGQVFNILGWKVLCAKIVLHTFFPYLWLLLACDMEWGIE